MSSNIGRKIILHKVPFPESSEEKDEFVLVTIDKVKEVPCLFAREKTQEVWRAIDEVGNYYYCNWEIFPDDSMTPPWSWQNEKNQMWYDVTQGMGHIPFRPIFMDYFQDIVHYCSKHQRLDYIEDAQSEAWVNFAKTRNMDLDNPCFDCLIDRPPVKKEEKNWNGWR